MGVAPYPELVSDPADRPDDLLLHSFGGSASAVSVVDFVMKIRRPHHELARMLVADLIDGDSRSVRLMRAIGSWSATNSTAAT